MKGNSDIYPKELELSNEKMQVRYNIVAVEKTDIDEKVRSSYDFNYVELNPKEVTKEAIAKAIADHPYFENDKQVILANKAVKIGAVSTKEYVEYMAKPTLEAATVIAEKIDLTKLEGKAG